MAHLALHPGNPLILDPQAHELPRRHLYTATDEEMQANAFATALLMPKHLVKNRLHHHLDHDGHASDADIVERLAADFQVSMQAMEYRLANLGLLTPA